MKIITSYWHGQNKNARKYSWLSKVIGVCCDLCGHEDLHEEVVKALAFVFIRCELLLGCVVIFESMQISLAKLLNPLLCVHEVWVQRLLWCVVIFVSMKIFMRKLLKSLLLCSWGVSCPWGVLWFLRVWSSPWRRSFVHAIYFLISLMLTSLTAS